MLARNNKGAIELSIGTIVILVLAMTMLILGLVLVRTIFSGANENVQVMNDKVKDQINKLFVEDKRMVVYLSNNKVEIDQGKDWGVGWAVKNLNTGTSSTATLAYEVSIEEIQEGCGIRDEEALSWISTGKKGNDIRLPPGQTEFFITRLKIPETAPLCLIRYRVSTKLDGNSYDSEFFDLEVKA